MKLDDSHISSALESAGMNSDPDPAHIEQVRNRMMALSNQRSRVWRRSSRVWAVGLLFFSVCGVALATTQTGRNLIRWVFTPIETQHQVTVVTTDGSSWTRSGTQYPYSLEEQKLAADQFEQVAELKNAGLGKLVAMYEVPEGTIYLIEYQLGSGMPMTVGDSNPSEQQRANMGLDQLQDLRDAGEGEVIVASQGPLGLGSFTIRFRLSNSQTIDLGTWYPPGTRDERAAIFAETRLLKADMRFTMDTASPATQDPKQGVFGTLRYTLADGRTVGIVERVPPDAVTDDGEFVAVPDAGDNAEKETDGTWTAPDGAQYTMSGVEDWDNDQKQAVVDQFRQIERIRQAGGGRLVGLWEGPGLFGELSRASYSVEYTLAGGETTTLGQGTLSDPQAANMRIEEIRQLRDAGAGELLSQNESRMGIGLFTIRFRLSDGETVDLQTWYPPAARKERDAIFAELRTLKAKRRFVVADPRVSVGSGVWGMLSYTLSDGQRVTHYEQVPTDLISDDGRWIVIPGIQERIEIAGVSD